MAPISKGTPKNNRSSRRKFARDFHALAKAGKWGDWQDESLTGKRALAIGVPKGLERFVANDLYSVQFYPRSVPGWGIVTRLVIRRNDGGKGVSWAHKQRIKNELISPEAQAIEVFPPESELVDAANCYHLWVIPEGKNLPFSLT